MIFIESRFVSNWLQKILILGCLLSTVAPAHNFSQALFPDLLPWAGELTEGQCARDSKLLRESAENGTLWAVRMADSSDRARGALEGKQIHLGSFHGCLSAGMTSPLRGALYCGVEVTMRPQLGEGEAQLHNWSHVDELPQDSDVRVALAGIGLADGFWQPGFVRVAVCVPISCSPAHVEAGLRAQLQADTAHAQRQVSIRVPLENCVDSDEQRAGIPMSAKIFWSGLAILTLVSVAAPFLGWRHCDWRRHLRELGAPAPEGMAALAGLRFLVTAMMVMLHRGIALSAVIALANQPIRESSLSSLPWVPFVQGHVHVYTFLFMSGILSVAVASKKQSKTEAFVMRLARLFPLMAVMIVFYVTALPSMGSGLAWKTVVGEESKACRDWWWLTALHICNYVSVPHGCLMQSWQLSVDMHLFVLTLLLRRHLLRFGPLLFLPLLVVSVLPPFLTALHYELPAVMHFTPKALTHLFSDPRLMSQYTPTHMRAAPYVMGIGCAMLLHYCKESRLRLSLLSTWLLTSLGLAVLAAVLLSGAALSDRSQPSSTLVAALFFSLSPAVWCAGLAAFFVALLFGEDTVVRGFLSWQPLVTLSRLSYGIFMTSLTMQLASTAALRQLLEGEILLVVYMGLSDLVISCALSLWLLLIIQAPVLSIIKEFFIKKALPKEKYEENHDLAESSRSHVIQRKTKTI